MRTQSDTGGKIFISYRRDDSAAICGRIYDRLRERFGAAAIFKDVDSLGLGEEFRTHIRDAIASSAVQLVIIGPRWLEMPDVHGGRRLDYEDDPVRQEVEVALKQGIPLIPLLVEKATMPRGDELPSSLAALVDHHGTEVRNDPDFERDIAGVLRQIEGLRAKYAEQQARRKAKARADKRAKRRQAVANAAAGAWKTPIGRGALFVLALVLLLVAVILTPLGRALASGQLFGRAATPTISVGASGVDASATKTVGAIRTASAFQTATATTFFVSPYTAPQPGPCDTNGAVAWQPPYNSSSDSVTCSTEGMRLDGNVGVNFVGFADGAFPSGFTVTVDMNLPSSSSGGILSRISVSNAGEGVALRPSGEWNVFTLDTTGQGTTRRAGVAPIKSTYTVSITVRYGYETIAINGAQIDSLQLASASSMTTAIGMSIPPVNDGTQKVAIFKNFTFTPLP